MKVVILAGGFGTRISKCGLSKAHAGDRRNADFVAYYEGIFLLWIS